MRFRLPSSTPPQPMVCYSSTRQAKNRSNGVPPPKGGGVKEERGKTNLTQKNTCRSISATDSGRDNTLLSTTGSIASSQPYQEGQSYLLNVLYSQGAIDLCPGLGPTLYHMTALHVVRYGRDSYGPSLAKTPSRCESLHLESFVGRHRWRAASALDVLHHPGC